MRISNRENQCVITIPIAIAREIGFDKCAFAKVKIIKNNRIEVEKIDIIKEKT